MKLSYRNEIDGLRAVAILVVVIYHAEIFFRGFHLFKGGYIGVDVFFVISGYLITSIILRQLQDKTFTLKAFYEKRTRRILPAFYAVILVSMPFAWLYLTPKALKEYSGSILSAMVSMSNFWFWKEDSYTAEASSLKPFLHTWSLSIEEQFYIFFPLLLMLLFKYRRNYIISILSLMFLFSLQFADYIVGNFPDMAFYLLPARAWELLAGALLAKLEIGHARTKYPVLNSIMPVIGLFLILHAAIFFDNSTRHPSFLTLIPVLGAMLIIWYSVSGELVTNILKSKILVGIGLISYSLYLWHWVIFSSIKIVGGTPTEFQKIVYIFLAILLASLTYFMIERPFRLKLSRSIFWSVIGMSSLIIIVVNLYIYKNDGLESRLEGRAITFKEFSVPEFRRLESSQLGINFRSKAKQAMCSSRDPDEACIFGNGKFVTLGDSFVGHYETALKRRLDKYGEGMMSLAHEQCPFVGTDIWFGIVPECPIVNEKRHRIIEGLKDQKIFIISADEGMFENSKKRTADPEKDAKSGMTGGERVETQKTLQSYKDNIKLLLSRGHIVIQIFSIPLPDMDPLPIYFNELKRHGKNEIFNIQPRYIENNVYDLALKADEKLEIPDHPNLIKIYPKDILCNNQQHQCLLISSGGPIYNSFRHMSIIGANMIIEKALDALESKGLIKLK